MAMNQTVNTTFTANVKHYNKGTRQASRETHGLISSLGRLHLAFGGVRTIIAAAATVGTPAIASLGAALAVSSGALLLLPAAAAAAGAAIGTVKLGAEGIEKAFSRMDESLTPLRQRVSSVFEQGLKPAVDDLNTILPKTTGGFMAIAREMSGVARASAATLALPKNTRDLNGVLGQTAGLMRGVRGAAAPMTQVLIDVVAVGAGGFTNFGVKISEAAHKFADFINRARETGQLKQWIDAGVGALKSLWQVVSDLSVTVWYMFKGISEGAGGISGALLPATSAMKNFAMSTGGQDFFRQVGRGLGYLAEAIGRILGSGLTSLAPIIGSLLNVFGALARVAGIVLMQAFRALAPLFGVLGTIINATLVPALHALAGWLERNRWFVDVLIVIFGIFAVKIIAFKLITMGLTTAIMVVSGAMKVWAAATKAAALAQAALNLAMRLSPIALIATAVVGLVAAFVVLWNKSAGFRLFWIGLWNGIKSVAISVWRAVGTALSAVWSNVIQPVFNALKIAWGAVGVAFRAVGAVLKSVWNGIALAFRIIFAAVLFPVVLAFRLAWLAATSFFKQLMKELGIAWGTISRFFRSVWDNVFVPVLRAFRTAWDATGRFFAVIGRGLRNAWNIVAFAFAKFWNEKIVPVIRAFRTAWDATGRFFALIGRGLRNAWNIVAFAFAKFWNERIVPVIRAFRTAWDAIGRFFAAIGRGLRNAWNIVAFAFAKFWTEKIVPVIRAFRTAWDAVGRFFGAIGRGIRNAWDGVGRAFGAVWSNVIAPVFRAFRAGYEALGRGIGVFVKGVETVWNKLKGIMAAPINFVVQKIYGKGIKWAWDKVAGIVGFPKLPPVPAPIVWSKGGVLDGYGPRQDKVPVMMSPGEAGLNPELTSALGKRNIMRANRLATTGRTGEAKDAIGGPSGRKGNGGDSGVWKKMRKIAQGIPGARVTSTFRPGDSGWHGSGNAIDIAGPMRNIATFLARRFPQSTQIIYGGAGSPSNPFPNIFHGKPHWYRNDAADHLDHVHWAMTQAAMDGKRGSHGRFNAEGGGSTFSDILNWIGGAAKNVMGWISNPIKSVTDKFKGAGKFIKAAGTVPLKLMGKAVSWIWNKINIFDGKDYVSGEATSGKGVDRWKGFVITALKDLKQYRPGLVGKVLRRMNQESGGDPNVVNNWDSNARKGTPSKGLMQVIQPTFDAYAGKYKSRGIMSPLANIFAGLNYALHTYPSIAYAMDKPGGYRNGGVLYPGQLAFNETREPELIFNQRQLKAMESGSGKIEKHYHLHANVSNTPTNLIQQFMRMEALEPPG